MKAFAIGATLAVVISASVPLPALAKGCDEPANVDVKRACEGYKDAFKMLANIEAFFAPRQATGPLAANAGVYGFSGCEDNKLLTGEASAIEGNLELFLQTSLRFVRIHVDGEAWEAATLTNPTYVKSSWRKSEVLSLDKIGKVQVYELARGAKVAFVNNAYWSNIVKENRSVKYSISRLCENEKLLQQRLTAFARKEMQRPFVTSSARTLFSGGGVGKTPESVEQQTNDAETIIDAAPSMQDSGNLDGLRAVVKAYKGANEDALLTANLALKVNRDSAWAKFARALANERLGFPEKARADYADGVAADDTTLQFQAKEGLKRVAPKQRSEADAIVGQLSMAKGALADVAQCKSSKRQTMRLVRDAIVAAWQHIRGELNIGFRPIAESVAELYRAASGQKGLFASCEVTGEDSMTTIQMHFGFVASTIKRRWTTSPFADDRSFAKKWLEDMTKAGLPMEEKKQE